MSDRKMNWVICWMAALSCLFLLGWTYTLKTSTPAGTDDPREADDRIRELKAAFVERLDTCMYFYPSATSTYDSADTGKFRYVIFREPNDLTDMAADESALFSKDVSSVVELHWIDESDNVLQMTSGGNLHSDQDFTMLTGKTAYIENIQAVDATGILLKSDGGTTAITIEDNGTATLADSSQMYSNAAPTAEWDIANKKYVDDQVNTKDFGSYSTDDDDSNTMVVSHAYLTNQDGTVYVVYTCGPSGGATSVYCYVDTDDNPASGGTIFAQHYDGVYIQNGDKFSLSFDVASGAYFEVTKSNVSSISIIWQSKDGTLVKCTDQD